MSIPSPELNAIVVCSNGLSQRMSPPFAWFATLHLLYAALLLLLWFLFVGRWRMGNGSEPDSPCCAGALRAIPLLTYYGRPLWTFRTDDRQSLGFTVRVDL